MNENMTIHQMSLNDEAYKQMESGIKTVEIRLFDEKRQKVKIGDFIHFTALHDENKNIQTRVLALHHFKTFEELFHANLYIQSGFEGYTVEEAVACMRKIYAEEKERTYGVLAIELERI